ncbi:chemokine-like protein TAFA-5 isoform X2 [Protopterus annectens]|uniref:chemokine-like protein TAFA-5 isoform X2 n=1 Tax=Protopterus annectens TaxID=7888 RepID=UPI001CFC0184|nr:chemokine-like protein TAFA-5 isoform X2 [Protopterus annectens]
MLASWKVLQAGTGAFVCCLLIIWIVYTHLTGEGHLAVDTCEIVTLDMDNSQPRRMIARQTARCACRRGQIAGTTQAKPACVDARIMRTKQWCEMTPCSEGEVCHLLFNRSGWTCTKGSGNSKTVTVGGYGFLHHESIWDRGLKFLQTPIIPGYSKRFAGTPQINTSWQCY